MNIFVIIYVEAEASQQNNDQDSFKVITKKVYHLSQIRDRLSHNVNIKIDFQINNEKIIQELYKIAEDFNGNCNLILHIMNNKGKLKKIKSTNILISNNIQCIDKLIEILGEHNVWLS